MKATNGKSIPLMALFVVSFGYWVGGAARVYEDLAYGTDHARLPFSFGLSAPQIKAVMPEAKDTGAHAGDTVTEFDGRPFTGAGVMREVLRNARPGTIVAATIRRADGTTAHIRMRLAPQRTAAATASDWVRGKVVGLLPGEQYAQSSLALLAGDILIAYTDGISEAMTHDGEEWGEDRTIRDGP